MPRGKNNIPNLNSRIIRSQQIKPNRPQSSIKIPTGNKAINNPNAIRAQPIKQQMNRVIATNKALCPTCGQSRRNVFCPTCA